MICFGPYDEKGIFLIHFREFYADGEQKHAPGRKGITFTVETWKTIMQNILKIDEEVKRESAKYYAKKLWSYITLITPNFP